MDRVVKTIKALRLQAEEEWFGCGKFYDEHADLYWPRASFRAGWDAAVKELTRWRDPKEELPEDGIAVIVKLYGKGRCVATFASQFPTRSRWFGLCSDLELEDDEVLGWRPIIEERE